MQDTRNLTFWATLSAQLERSPQYLQRVAQSTITMSRSHHLLPCRPTGKRCRLERPSVNGVSSASTPPSRSSTQPASCGTRTASSALSVSSRSPTASSTSSRAASTASMTSRCCSRPAARRAVSISNMAAAAAAAVTAGLVSGGREGGNGTVQRVILCPSCLFVL